MAKTILTFSLDSERDRDILVYFGSLSSGERSLRFREIVRGYIGDSPFDRIERRLTEIEHMLKSGVATVEHGNTEGKGDPRNGAIKAMLKDFGK